MGTFYAGGVPLAEVVRSGFAEGYHRGSVVVLDAAGTVVAAAGDVTAPMFPRSANKPMQAVGMLGAGLRLADPADLALVSASHWGESFHVARVAALLRAGGLDESALDCPPSLPLDPDAAAGVARGGGGPSRILMNCSGKHAGMLLTCRAAGWPLEGYLTAEHPLQVAITRAVESCAGEKIVASGVDGCGAPVLALSLGGLARAYLGLVAAEPGSAEERVASAMRAHPELVSGTASPEARLMGSGGGVPGLLIKGGAEGVLAAAVPGTGAVAVKIDDGAERARMPVLVSALRRLGVSSPALAALAEFPLLGGGQPVGAVRCVW